MTNQKARLPHIAMLILAVIIMIAAVIIFIQLKENRSLRNALPYLTRGEKIDYFDLSDKEGHYIQVSHLKGDRISLIFVFKDPCATCNINMAIWNRLAGILQDKVSIYGIVPAEPVEEESYNQEPGFKFPIYWPIDAEQFRESMRIRLNLSETILCYGNHILFIKIGDLKGDDYTGIIRRVKALIQEKEK